jgi:hypothetical protein
MNFAKLTFLTQSDIQNTMKHHTFIVLLYGYATNFYNVTDYSAYRPTATETSMYFNSRSDFQVTYKYSANSLKSNIPLQGRALNELRIVVKRSEFSEYQNYNCIQSQ